MIRASGRHHAQAQCTLDQSLADPYSGCCIILGNEGDDILEVVKGTVRNQDLVFHEATEPWSS
jgi:hypothetical protein